MVWMIVGGCLAMLFGAFKHWTATQTDRYAFDTTAGLNVFYGLPY
jgi:hypothetical protein